MLVGVGGMVWVLSSSTILGSSTNDPATKELWNVAFSSSTVSANSFRKDLLLGAFVESTVTFPPNILFDRMRMKEEFSMGLMSVLLLAAKAAAVWVGDSKAFVVPLGRSALVSRLPIRCRGVPSSFVAMGDDKCEGTVVGVGVVGCSSSAV